MNEKKILQINSFELSMLSLGLFEHFEEEARLKRHLGGFTGTKIGNHRYYDYDGTVNRSVDRLRNLTTHPQLYFIRVDMEEDYITVTLRRGESGDLVDGRCSLSNLSIMTHTE